MISVKNFLQKENKLKNETTSNKKSMKSFLLLFLNGVGICLRNCILTANIRKVHLDRTEGTHSVAYKEQNLFDSYGTPPSVKMSMFIIKRNGYCLCFECKPHVSIQLAKKFFFAQSFYV